MRAIAASAGFVTALLAPSAASAEPDRVRYGAITALANGAALSVTGLGLTIWVSGGDDTEVPTSLGDPFVIGGAAVFALAAPAVHLAHGNRRGALASLGVHVLVPAAGAGLVAMLEDDLDREHVVGGALVGGLVAALVDAVWLADAPAGEASLAPYVQPSYDGGNVGVRAVW